jgi:hypothetical protein
MGKVKEALNSWRKDGRQYFHFCLHFGGRRRRRRRRRERTPKHAAAAPDGWMDGIVVGRNNTTIPQSNKYLSAK